MKTSTLRNVVTTIISFMFILSLSAQNSSEKNDLLLKFGNVNLVENLDNYINQFDISNEDIVNGHYYKIIQFNTMPDRVHKASLNNSGISLLEFIPNRAFVVSIPEAFNLLDLKKYNIRSITDIPVEYKQDPYILDKNYPEWALRENGEIDLIVTFFKDILLEDGARSIAPYSQKIVQNDPLSNYQIIRTKIADIDAITASPMVYFVEPVYPDGEPENTTGKTLHRSNVLDSQYETGRHYDGTGVKVMLQDDGIIGPHIDYEGRIGAQNLTYNWGDHGDHCAGTIFGYGNLDPTVNGMAPGAEIHTWGAAPEYPGFASIYSEYNTTGVRITSTSYSNGCNAGYTSLARTMDVHIRNYESLMHVFSAGNAGGDNCGYGAGAGWGNITGGHKVGKNVIATANVNENGSISGSSSRGPAHDGRIKPDISAKGSSVTSTVNPNTYAVFSGTSMACPGIAGSLAQLYQAYNELNGEDPKGGLMKALIMNTANDLGNVGPDYKYGWGHINNLKAVEVLEDEMYLTDEIDQDDLNTHDIEVPDGVKEMKVMVYWTDKEASVNASKALVNDLNITMTDPSDNEHFPWVLNPYPHADSLDKPAVKGIDDLNNVEQVLIDEPASGTYTLNIEGTEIAFGPQEYYVIYDFIYDEIVLTYPIGGESISSTDNINVRWDAYGNDGTFTVEYSIDNGTNWIVINSNINGSLRSYNWNVPSEITSGAKFRISRDDLSSESVESFSIMGITSDIIFARACPTSVLVKWEPVEDAVSYDIFMLGEKYMEVIGSTTTDSLLVEDIDYEEEYWFAVRAIGPDNAIGRRSMAEQKDPGIWNCIFAKDLALTDMISPPTGVLFGCQDYSDLPVQLEIKNHGLDDLGNITINYQFENEPVVTETYTGTLSSGETLIYEFASSVSLPSNGIYDMEAWIEVNGDENGANDVIAGTSKVKSSTYLDVQTLINFDDYNNCAFTDNCEGTICYLDNQYYNMQSGVNDDIDWRVLSGITPTQNTGPIGDHTTGTGAGKFLYLEASGECYNQKAILTTPCIDLSSLTNPGITFWFNMLGADMGTLHLDAVSEGVLHKDIMDPLSGDWGEGWHEGHAYLAQFSGKEITLRFRGQTGNGELSDLAIDDITITEITGLEENSTTQSFRVFPNPSNGAYSLVFEEEMNSYVNLKVIDITGRTVYAKNLDGIQPNRAYSIDISSFDKGIYYLMIESSTGELKEKLLKY